MLAKKRKFEQKIKSPKQMERHLKGVANHYRIEILMIINDNEGIILDDIIEKTGANAKTIGEHTRKLSQAGLVNKKYRGKFVEHVLSPYGKTFIRFIRSFQRA
jgi:DNA-binding MarR family transcriptional regulator